MTVLARNTAMHKDDTVKVGVQDTAFLDLRARLARDILLQWSRCDGITQNPNAIVSKAMATAEEFYAQAQALDWVLDAGPTAEQANGREA